MRQTDLSFEELLAELEKPVYSRPRCLIINEIGEFLKEGNKEAEKVLRGFLNNDSENDRHLAFCWLSCVDELEKETRVKLEEFKIKPENDQIIKIAEEQIRNFKAKFN